MSKYCAISLGMTISEWEEIELKLFFPGFAPLCIYSVSFVVYSVGAAPSDGYSG